MRRVKKGSIDQATYDLIKTLKGLGLQNTEIGRIVGRSSTTVGNVARSESLEAHKATVTALRSKYPKRGVEPEVSPEEVVTDTVTKAPNNTEAQMIEVLQNITDVLNELDKRLIFLEDHIEVVPKRKLFR